MSSIQVSKKLTQDGPWTGTFASFTFQFRKLVKRRRQLFRFTAFVLVFVAVLSFWEISRSGRDFDLVHAPMTPFERRVYKNEVNVGDDKPAPKLDRIQDARTYWKAKNRKERQAMIVQPVEEMDDDHEERWEDSTEQPIFMPGHPLPPSLRAHDSQQRIRQILPTKSKNGEQRRTNKATQKESVSPLFDATRIKNVPNSSKTRPNVLPPPMRIEDQFAQLSQKEIDQSRSEDPEDQEFEDLFANLQ